MFSSMKLHLLTEGEVPGYPTSLNYPVTYLEAADVILSTSSWGFICLS